MKRMRRFLTTLGVVWTAAVLATYFYSQHQNIPYAIRIAVVPAILLETAFYVMPGSEWARKTFDALGARPLRAALLTASAVLPCLVATVRADTFQFPWFLTLLAAALAASFWYAWIRPNLAVDLLFLAFMAAIYLSKLFDHAYGQPAPHAQLAYLGRLMWIRLGIMAVLSLRGLEDVKFGFWPAAREWRIGFLYYLAFLPVGGVLAYLLGFARFHPPEMEWWKAALLVIGTFLAFLWVVALAEEFFFRAFLQRLLTRARGETFGLITASVLFGLTHLPFRPFPNWRFAIVAGIAGVFYGLAFTKAGSVRASMVTHALAVTTWRVFFV
jgi:membrane protease YdiL (CAAX protease family)